MGLFGFIGRAVWGSKPAGQQSPAGQPAADQGTLYARLGGEAAITAATDVFYVKVLADELLKPYFEGVPMEKQRAKQVKFLTYATGGAGDWGDRSIFRTHAHMIKHAGLGLQHFDRVAELLVASLAQLGVQQGLIDEVVARVGPLRDLFDPSKYEENARAEGMMRSGAASTAGSTHSGSVTPSDGSFAKSPLKLNRGERSPAQDPSAVNKSEAVQPSLYERIGGGGAVVAAVDIFYQKVLGDPLLVPFFEGIPMDRQKAKQVKFLTFAFGGSKGYSGPSLAAAHKSLIEEKGLGLVHFDAVAGHLVETLKELSVPQPLIDEAATIVMTTRSVFDPAAREASKAAEQV